MQSSTVFANNSAPQSKCAGKEISQASEVRTRLRFEAKLSYRN